MSQQGPGIAPLSHSKSKGGSFQEDGSLDTLKVTPSGKERTSLILSPNKPLRPSQKWTSLTYNRVLNSLESCEQALEDEPLDSNSRPRASRQESPSSSRLQRCSASPIKTAVSPQAPMPLMDALKDSSEAPQPSGGEATAPQPNAGGDASEVGAPEEIPPTQVEGQAEEFLVGDTQVLTCVSDQACAATQVLGEGQNRVGGPASLPMATQILLRAAHRSVTDAAAKACPIADTPFSFSRGHPLEQTPLPMAVLLNPGGALFDPGAATQVEGDTQVDAAPVAEPERHTPEPTCAPVAPQGVGASLRDSDSAALPLSAAALPPPALAPGAAAAGGSSGASAHPQSGRGQSRGPSSECALQTAAWAAAPAASASPDGAAVSAAPAIGSGLSGARIASGSGAAAELRSPSTSGGPAQAAAAAMPAASDKSGAALAAALATACSGLSGARGTSASSAQLRSPTSSKRGSKGGSPAMAGAVRSAEKSCAGATAGAATGVTAGSPVLTATGRLTALSMMESSCSQPEIFSSLVGSMCQADEVMEDYSRRALHGDADAGVYIGVAEAEFDQISAALGRKSRDVSELEHTTWQRAVMKARVECDMLGWAIEGDPSSSPEAANLEYLDDSIQGYLKPGRETAARMAGPTALASGGLGAIPEGVTNSEAAGGLELSKPAAAPPSQPFMAREEPGKGASQGAELPESFLGSLLGGRVRPGPAAVDSAPGERPPPGPGGVSPERRLASVPEEAASPAANRGAGEAELEAPALPESSSGQRSAIKLAAAQASSMSVVKAVPGRALAEAGLPGLGIGSSMTPTLPARPGALAAAAASAAVGAPGSGTAALHTAARAAAEATPSGLDGVQLRLFPHDSLPAAMSRLASPSLSGLPTLAGARGQPPPPLPLPLPGSLLVVPDSEDPAPAGPAAAPTPNSSSAPPVSRPPGPPPGSPDLMCSFVPATAAPPASPQRPSPLPLMAAGGPGFGDVTPETSGGRPGGDGETGLLGGASAAVPARRRLGDGLQDLGFTQESLEAPVSRPKGGQAPALQAQQAAGRPAQQAARGRKKLSGKERREQKRKDLVASAARGFRPELGARPLAHRPSPRTAPKPAQGAAVEASSPRPARQGKLVGDTMAAQGRKAGTVEGLPAEREIRQEDRERGPGGSPVVNKRRPVEKGLGDSLLDSSDRAPSGLVGVLDAFPGGAGKGGASESAGLGRPNQGYGRPQGPQGDVAALCLARQGGHRDPYSFPSSQDLPSGGDAPLQLPTRRVGQHPGPAQRGPARMSAGWGEIRTRLPSKPLPEQAALWPEAPQAEEPIPGAGYVFGGAVEDAPASAPSSPEGPTLARLQASKQVQKANARKLVPKKGRLGLNQPLAGGSPDSRPAKRARQVPTRFREDSPKAGKMAAGPREPQKGTKRKHSPQAPPEGAPEPAHVYPKRARRTVPAEQQLASPGGSLTSAGAAAVLASALKAATPTPPAANRIPEAGSRPEAAGKPASGLRNQYEAAAEGRGGLSGLDADAGKPGRGSKTLTARLGCSKCRYAASGCGKCRHAGVTPPPKAVQAGPAVVPASTTPGTGMRPPAGQNAAPASAEVPRSSPRRAAAAARNLGAAAGSPHAGGTRSGVLAGLTLMVTGYAGDVAERQRVCRLIQANGGALLSEVPPPEQAATGNRRVPRGAPHPSPCDAIISDRTMRTPKYLYGLALGCIILKPSWLHDSIAQGTLVPLDTAPAWEPAAPLGRRVFAGMCVYLHGSKRFCDQFGPVLQHAGAMLAESVTAPVSAARGSKPGGATGRVLEACHLIIVESLDAARQQQGGPQDPTPQDLEALHSLARQLGIPVQDREWAIRGLAAGALPSHPDPSESPSDPSGNPSGDSTGRNPPAGTPAPAPAAANGPVPKGKNAGKRRRGGVAGAGAASSPGEACPTNAARKGPAEADGEEECVVQPSMDFGVSQDALNGGPGSTGGTPSGPRWIGACQAPPPGFPATLHRKFYGAFMLGDARVLLGDCIELAPEPGESHSRVAQVQALWSECLADGQERKLARCRRFYRPEETMFYGSGNPREVFKSGHIEERISLAAVVGKVTVNLVRPGRQATLQDPQDSSNVHLCMYYYDHEVMCLRPVDI